MFRSSFQKGCFSIFYSVGSTPTSNWLIHTQNGYAKRVLDEDIHSMVMELSGNNVSVMFMTCPRDPKLSLGIKLPFLVLLIKNMHKYFTFEIKIMDDTRFNRRFRVSNFQNRTSVKPFCTQMPLGMSPGWNQIHFNLADFTRRAYGTSYMETVSLQVHANVRIRRIYFTDRLYSEDELPNEYRLMQKPKERQKSKNDFKVPAARPPSPAKSVEGSMIGLGHVGEEVQDMEQIEKIHAPFGDAEEDIFGLEEAEEFEPMAAAEPVATAEAAPATVAQPTAEAPTAAPAQELLVNDVFEEEGEEEEEA